MTEVTLVTTFNNLPNELLRSIAIIGGPTVYCKLRLISKRFYSLTQNKDIADHIIKHFLVTKISEDGDTETTLCGLYHNVFDLPTFIEDNVVQEWYQYGECHRDDDLPAVIWDEGTQFWYQHDKLHRDNDQPAEIRSDGTKLWYRYGEFHRDNDKPAITYKSGRKRWYKCNVEYVP